MLFKSSCGDGFRRQGWVVIFLVFIENCLKFSAIKLGVAIGVAGVLIKLVLMSSPGIISKPSENYDFIIGKIKF